MADHEAHSGIAICMGGNEVRDEVKIGRLGRKWNAGSYFVNASSRNFSQRDTSAASVLLILNCRLQVERAGLC